MAEAEYMLEELGWDGKFAESLSRLGDAGLCAARVVSQGRKEYLLIGADGEFMVPVSGRLVHKSKQKAQLPTVGDWVAVRPGKKPGDWRLEAVLPRKSWFSRKEIGESQAEQVIAANIDYVFVVSGLDGEFKPRRVERYLTLAENCDVEAIIVLNKKDLCDDVAGCVKAAEAVAGRRRVHTVCALMQDGLEDLRRYLCVGKTIAMLGSSGVGKSTLINDLLGEKRQKTREVRDSDGEGRHTTTRRELIVMPGGGLLIDTPGMRELQLWASREALEEAFADVLVLAQGCKFRDCKHDSEPGCAVRAAMEAGDFSAERFDSYQELQVELEKLAKRQNEKMTHFRRNRGAGH